MKRFSFRRLSLYIFDTITPFFLTVFISLFAIASLVFLIQIAAATSVLHVTMGEFALMYTFLIPQLLFYTLPISFFAGSVLGLSKLSFDMEMIVLFTLRASLREILRPVAFLAVITSVLLFLLGLVMAPTAMIASKHFLIHKQFQANLNLKSSELGQKFGDWIIFAHSSTPEKRMINDLILYMPDETQDKLITAKMGQTSTINDVFQLHLSQGRGFIFDWEVPDKETLRLIQFESMKINKTAKHKIYEESDPLSYWLKGLEDKKRAKDFRAVVMTALFPLLALIIIPMIGIVNPRHQKNHAYPLILGVTLFYYVGVFLLSPTLGGTLGFLLCCAVGSFVMYRRTVAKRY